MWVILICLSIYLCYLLFKKIDKKVSSYTDKTIGKITSMAAWVGSSAVNSLLSASMRPVKQGAQSAASLSKKIGDKSLEKSKELWSKTVDKIKDSASSIDKKKLKDMVSAWIQNSKSIFSKKTTEENEEEVTKKTTTSSDDSVTPIQNINLNPNSENQIIDNSLDNSTTWWISNINNSEISKSIYESETKPLSSSHFHTDEVEPENVKDMLEVISRYADNAFDDVIDRSNYIIDQLRSQFQTVKETDNTLTILDGDGERLRINKNNLVWTDFENTRMEATNLFSKLSQNKDLNGDQLLLLDELKTLVENTTSYDKYANEYEKLLWRQKDLQAQGILDKDGNMIDIHNATINTLSSDETNLQVQDDLEVQVDPNSLPNISTSSINNNLPDPSKSIDNNLDSDSIVNQIKQGTEETKNSLNTLKQNLELEDKSDRIEGQDYYEDKQRIDSPVQSQLFNPDDLVVNNLSSSSDNKDDDKKSLKELKQERREELLEKLNDKKELDLEMKENKLLEETLKNNKKNAAIEQLNDKKELDLEMKQNKLIDQSLKNDMKQDKKEDLSDKITNDLLKKSVWLQEKAIKETKESKAKEQLGNKVVQKLLDSKKLEVKDDKITLNNKTLDTLNKQFTSLKEKNDNPAVKTLSEDIIKNLSSLKVNIDSGKIEANISKDDLTKLLSWTSVLTDKVIQENKSSINKLDSNHSTSMKTLIDSNKEQTNKLIENDKMNLKSSKLHSDIITDKLIDTNNKNTTSILNKNDENTSKLEDKTSKTTNRLIKTNEELAKKASYDNKVNTSKIIDNENLNVNKVMKEDKINTQKVINNENLNLQKTLKNDKLNNDKVIQNNTMNSEKIVNTNNKNTDKIIKNAELEALKTRKESQLLTDQLIKDSNNQTEKLLKDSDEKFVQNIKVNEELNKKKSIGWF